MALPTPSFLFHWIDSRVLSNVLVSTLTDFFMVLTPEVLIHHPTILPNRGFGTSRHKGHLDHLMSHVLGHVLGQGPEDGLGLAREERRLNPYLPLVPVTPQSFVLAHPTWLILHDYGETKVSMEAEFLYYIYNYTNTWQLRWNMRNWGMSLRFSI